MARQTRRAIMVLFVIIKKERSYKVMSKNRVIIVSSMTDYNKAMKKKKHQRKCFYCRQSTKQSNSICLNCSISRQEKEDKDFCKRYGC